MLQSMTGFGKSEVTIQGIRYTIEIKSLNSKSIDLNVRLPSWMRGVELEIRKIISESLLRGKIDVYINTELLDKAALVNLNTSLIKTYMQQMEDISSGISEEKRFAAAMQLPDIFQADQKEFSEDDWEIFKNALDNAIVNITEFRKDEGRFLQDELQMRIVEMDSFLQQIPEYEQERIERLKDRIHKSLDSLQEVDKDRLEQELIFYLEKLDITEEKVRLKNHLEYFLETMGSEDSNGKKLGFITQEIGREVNTLGSKSNHAEMQKLVVQMKDELEKIKEQMLNIL